MFIIPKMGESLTCHSTSQSVDGKMHHPVDSPSWTLINNKWPEFTNDTCNLRLGVTVDGFNPFNNFRFTYSCWLVMVVIYNLSPWLCMKKRKYHVIIVNSKTWMNSSGMISMYICSRYR